ncbi:glycosyltransferase family 4 protein [Devosia ginsengisoli]|nr:glycosyltransferase family 4 protein [Devosia ginsengisoli]
MDHFWSAGEPEISLPARSRLGLRDEKGPNISLEGSTLSWRPGFCHRFTNPKGLILRILHLHTIGAFGGASRSLFEALRALPLGIVQSHFVTQKGTVVPFFSQIGPVIAARGISQFDHTRYGRYRRLRWLVLLREIAFLPATVLALLRARKAWGDVDLIHANEVTAIVPLLLARWLFRAPVIVHVRSVMQKDGRGLRSALLRRLLDSAAAVVAIDETVRASLPAVLDVDVVHNGFLPKVAEQTNAAIAALPLRGSSFKVGFVGNLLRVKGVAELIEAARQLQARAVDVEFILVGDDARPSKGLKARILKRLGLAQDMRAEIEAEIAAHDLGKNVHLVGFQSDIASVYRSFDVLCFPSHYDAPGRPIFEAAFSEVPSIVALTAPLADTLVDGVTGIAIHPRDAGQLANAIALLAEDRAYSARLGIAAGELARSNFDISANAQHLLAIYRRVLSSDQTGGSRKKGSEFAQSLPKRGR